MHVCVHVCTCMCICECVCSCVMCMWSSDKCSLFYALVLINTIFFLEKEAENRLAKKTLWGYFSQQYCGKGQFSSKLSHFWVCICQDLSKISRKYSIWSSYVINWVVNRILSEQIHFLLSFDCDLTLYLK